LSALLWLIPTSRRSYYVEVRPSAELGAVRLELHRTDCKPSPVVRLFLDDARVLLRKLQGACDLAERSAYIEYKNAKARAELDRVVDRVAETLR
jgi:hypothetical protein